MTPKTGKLIWPYSKPLPGLNGYGYAPRARTAKPQTARTSVSLSAAMNHLLKELSAIKAQQVSVTCNAVLRCDGLPASRQPKVADTGVAVWFLLPTEPDWLCMSSDGWDSIAANMRAIGLALAALRSASTHLLIPLPPLLDHLFGAHMPAEFHEQRRQQEQASQPPPAKAAKPGSWRDVLELGGKFATYAMVVANYRRLAKLRHPDKSTGSTEAFQQLQAAFEQAKKHFNFK